MQHESQLRVLYLYQIFLRYSNPDHPISTNDIIQMMGIASDRDAVKLKRNIFTAMKVKTTNRKVLYIIDTINDAITAGRQISFKYMNYDAQKSRFFAIMERHIFFHHIL